MIAPSVSIPSMSNPSFYRPCWIDISLDALRHNVQLLRQRVASPVQLCAVVKANAYGHGLVPMSRVVSEEGAVYLGISSLEEGIALRNAGIQTPVLILGSIYPFENFSLLFDHKLTPTLASLEAAENLDKLAQKHQQKIPVHLKIDSGFGRIGVTAPNAVEFIQRVAACKGLEIEGIYTHFASSDIDEEYTRTQTDAFQGVLREVQAKGIRPRWIHMANSSALIRYPETHGTMVRPGIALYGIAPFRGAERDVALRPILSWKTRIIFLKTTPPGTVISYARTWVAKRTTRVATLAVGYADGLPRLLSNQGQVLIGGQKVPILGRITMDMIMVDVTDVPNCHVGDEAVLIGRQGSEQLPVEEWARWAQTNPYEIVCRISDRVPRVYNA